MQKNTWDTNNTLVGSCGALAGDAWLSPLRWRLPRHSWSRVCIRKVLICGVSALSITSPGGTNHTLTAFYSYSHATQWEVLECRGLLCRQVILIKEATERARERTNPLPNRRTVRQWVRHDLYVFMLVVFAVARACAARAFLVYQTLCVLSFSICDFPILFMKGLTSLVGQNLRRSRDCIRKRFAQPRYSGYICGTPLWF